MRQARLYISPASLTLLLLCQLIIMGPVVAQNSQGQLIMVKGTVTAPDGSPLIGASVTDKKTNNATATDGKGEYSLSIASDGELEISMVGF